MTNKEKLLEEKVKTLEQRLLLVERFVELRYCETFRDFTIRNSGSTKKSPPSGDGGTGETGTDLEGMSGNEENYGHKPAFRSSERNLRATRQNTTKGSDKPGPASSKKKGPSSAGNGNNHEGLRDCVVRVVKFQTGNLGAGASESSSAATGNEKRPRYGTRKQTRLSQQQVVKHEVLSDGEINIDSSACLQIEGEDSIDVGDHEDVGTAGLEEGSEEESYFTFPTDHHDEQDDNDDSARIGYASVDNDDRDWSGGDGGGGGDNDEDASEDQDGDYDPKKSKSPRRKHVPTKRKFQSTATVETRGRKKLQPDKRRKRKSYLTSISDLPKDAKILSSDASRAECPICRQYWKVEFIQNHIESHMKERHIKCSKCDKRYFKVDDLRHHMNIKHNRDKYPKCRLCNTPVVRKMIFHEKYCVKKKIQNGEPVDESLVEDIRKQCAKLGLEFSLPGETLPPGVDPTEKVECPDCKKFFQRRVFDRHVKTHSLPRNWKCSKCPKAYIHKHDLVRHMCVSHDSSFNKCEFCRESFDSRQDLYNHKRTTCSNKRRKLKGGQEVAKEAEEIVVAEEGEGSERDQNERTTTLTPEAEENESVDVETENGNEAVRMDDSAEAEENPGNPSNAPIQE